MCKWFVRAWTDTVKWDFICFRFSGCYAINGPFFFLSSSFFWREHKMCVCRQSKIIDFFLFDILYNRQFFTSVKCPVCVCWCSPPKHRSLNMFLSNLHIFLVIFWCQHNLPAATEREKERMRKKKKEGKEKHQKFVNCSDLKHHRQLNRSLLNAMWSLKRKSHACFLYWQRMRGSWWRLGMVWVVNEIS